MNGFQENVWVHIVELATSKHVDGNNETEFSFELPVPLVPRLVIVLWVETPNENMPSIQERA
jgi:hypothetical protein